MVTVLTDLRDSWQFWWLSDSAKCILTYATKTPKEGLWLLSHCIPGSTTNVATNLFPDEFLTRGSWHRLTHDRLLVPIQEEKRDDDDDSGDLHSDHSTTSNKENPSTQRAVPSSTSSTTQLSSSTSTKNQSTRQRSSYGQLSMSDIVAPLRELYGSHDVANHLDLIEMTDDVNEHHDLIKQFVLEHQFPKSWTGGRPNGALD